MSANPGGLPAATRLGRVRLRVSDLQRAADWYRDVLGLQPLTGRAADTAAGGSGAADAATLALGGVDREPLVELIETAGAAPAPARGRLGLYHYAILLPDRTSLGRLLRHLARHGVRIGAADHRVSEAIYLSDPDGLGIEVYTDRPRDSWSVSDGELVMTTDPLDVDDLIAAAASDEWQDMPAETRIGHVHFHVADLAAARAFYVDGLGFQPTVTRYPGALFVAAGGYHHHVGLNTWAGRAARPPADGETCLLDWRLEVPRVEDVDAIAARLEAGSFAFDRAEHSLRAPDPWGTTMVVAAAD